MRRLGPNAGLILSLLRLHPHSGYDLKKHADTSLRPFWAMGFPQIYRELRALSHARLIEAAEERTARRRRRYRLTASGKRGLRAWLRDAPAKTELRDEMLLKLYCAAFAAPEELVPLVAVARSREQSILDAIATMRAHLASPGHDDAEVATARLVVGTVEAMHRAYVKTLSSIERIAQRRSATSGGPRKTTSSAGRMQNVSGKSISTGRRRAVASAR